jgi:hypothetical protein
MERVLERGPGEAGVQELQAEPTMPIVGGGHRPEKAQITLAPPARIGPPLAGATGWANHLVTRRGSHLALFGHPRVPERALYDN